MDGEEMRAYGVASSQSRDGSSRDRKEAHVPTATGVPLGEN
jgi:hypothetical protein